MFALYAQDRWTIGPPVAAGRTSLRAPRATTSPSSRWGRTSSCPPPWCSRPQDGPLNQKDLMPRFGASYDVFGNGKTAVKFFMGRYVTTFNTVDEWVNYSPAGLGHFVTHGHERLDRREPRLRRRLQPAEPGRQRRVRPGESVLREASLSADGRPGDHERLEHARVQLGYDARASRSKSRREYRCKSTTSAGAGETCRPRSTARGRRPTSIRSSTTCRRIRKLPGGGGYALTFYDVKPGEVPAARQLPDVRRQRRRRVQQRSTAWTSR